MTETSKIPWKNVYCKSCAPLASSTTAALFSFAFHSFHTVPNFSSSILSRRWNSIAVYSSLYNNLASVSYAAYQYPRLSAKQTFVKDLAGARPVTREIMSEKGTYEQSPKALEESPIDTSNNTARTSIDTATDPEVQRENVRHANPNGFSSTNTGIDVKAAEAEFATLQRELSGISQTSRRLSRTQSRQSKKGVSEKDVEQLASEDSTTDEEAFDLESTLRGNHHVRY